MAVKSVPMRADLLFPPVFDSDAFRYFQDAARHPFRRDATGFELVNAWWLAESALLAYSSREFVSRKFGEVGLTLPREAPYETSVAHCYIAFDDSLVIVVFRGTEVPRPDLSPSLGEAWLQLKDVIAQLRADARIALEETSPGSTRYVHRGFREALDGVWPEVVAQLRALRAQRPQRSFWFAGHSMGAAMATLAVDRFGGARALYTFGSPRVGNESFAKSFPTPAFRFVDNNDIVPLVPTHGLYADARAGIGRYQHVGELKYLDADGRLLSSPRLGRRLWDWLRGHQHSVVEGLQGLLDGHPLALAPDGLLDHAPLLYAIRVWNAYEDSRSR
ncbi:MAG: hypothetical protein C5B46_04335 [Proteobacteria bacterium]|nr:MAG: hypothetical protein C5B46_04335 [Pseudomonadota bacterium]